jgi:Cu-Zn family superoxide dismutase
MRRVKATGWLAGSSLAAATLLIACSPDGSNVDSAAAPEPVASDPASPISARDQTDAARPASLAVSDVSERRAAESAAHASIAGTEGNSISGEIAFDTRTDGLLDIGGEIVGLTPGQHGFHIHENGDCSAPDADSAGGHFAPDGHPHGAPTAANDQHHSGDLGNIEANADGIARISMTSDVLTVTGDHGVVGHAVVVHADEDDLRSQPSGAAGARVACGLIDPVDARSGSAG